MPKVKSIFSTAFSTYTENCIIGEGGTSKIYEVFDNYGSSYALKLFKFHNKEHSDYNKRFRNEIFFGLNNSYPNIVSIIDTGIFSTDDKLYPFYIMPKYAFSLRELLHKKIKEMDIIKYFCQILDGIEVAHLKNIFHRDIKPENILYDEKQDNLLISDFGIAHFCQEQIYTPIDTKDGTRLANFQYASPEQRMRDTIVDHRTDIYSLGLILNEMVTNTIPIGTSYQNIANVFPNLCFLDKIVEKMISQTPDNRYYSINEIKLDIISRQSEYIHLQKLNDEKTKVVPTFNISDDPLYDNVNEVINVEWKNNTIYIYLKYHTNSKWISALCNLGNYSYVMNKEPSRFSISKNVASISAMEQDAQPIIDHFIEWLPLAHRQYKYTLDEENKQKEYEIKRQQEIRIKEAEKTFELNKKLHF